ncbi:hypothetical protein [Paraclostridium bifermentans]|uniref:hypothetical protein n=1 Tax=Paraclostridium bifermentans TaxID=1490 RepID=UPI001159728A|nr:hypothetical protein [Paraclostridium bifermentans]TQO55585.1 hypothetical protein D5S05_17380 [Paraclostridium bifermentans]
MKRFIFILIIFVITFEVLYSIKNKIESTKLFESGREIVTLAKESCNESRIENFNDLISQDNVDVDGVKRVNLDWDKIGNSLNMLKGTPIPSGYKLGISCDEYILIDDDFTSNTTLSEKKMLDFLKNNYLPSDIKFIKHKSWFEKGHKTNSTNKNIEEYTYKSLVNGYTYTVRFEYNYIEKNEKEILENRYSDVIINRNK